MEAKTYRLRSPYEEVVWTGDNAWQAYKGNLHTHTTASDGEADLCEIVKSYYEHGFDFLAVTDHGLNGRAWDREPTRLFLYSALRKIRKTKLTVLTKQEKEDIEHGLYPLSDGTPRGKGMLCVPGGNELNMATLTKCHINGFFQRGCEAFAGFENGYETAVKAVEKRGGISFINHPGDWIHTNKDRDRIHDKDMIRYFASILLRYKSCLGIEVFNEKNGATPWDRVLWDHLLQFCLPYGKRVIGFSNGDTHILQNVDSSFCFFFMPSLTLENIRKTMPTGASFLVTRMIRKDPVFGPDADMDRRDSEEPIPLFTKIETENHTIRVSASDFDRILWIADGAVIRDERFEAQQRNGISELCTDDYFNGDPFLYIRIQISGRGGICLSQPIIADDGSEKPVFRPSVQDKLKKIPFAIKSARAVVLPKATAGEIRYQIKRKRNKNSP